MTIAQLFFSINRKTAVTTVLIFNKKIEPNAKKCQLIKTVEWKSRRISTNKLDLIKVVIACTKSGLQNC